MTEAQRELRRARDARYSASEKGRARYLKYWHKSGGGRHKRRERQIRDLDAKIDAMLTEHPWLEAYLS